MDGSGDKVMKELREVVAAAEELLASGAGAERMGEIEEQVKKHPVAALAIAAGVGLILGLLLSRK